MKTSPLRKVAMRLACGHPDDRNWILAQLEEQQRRQLEAMLEEINLLGLAADPSVVDAFLKQDALGFDAPAYAEADMALLGQSARATHPFWEALLLQLLSAEKRQAALRDSPQAERVKRWDAAFARQPLPPLLAATLQAYLRSQESPHGRI